MLNRDSSSDTDSEDVAHGFEEAVAWVANFRGHVSNLEKLDLYALYKMATTALKYPSLPRPGVSDFQGRAKYDAWLEMGRSMDDADQQLVQRCRAQYCVRAMKLGWQDFPVDDVGDTRQAQTGMIIVSTMAGVHEDLDR